MLRGSQQAETHERSFEVSGTRALEAFDALKTTFYNRRSGANFNRGSNNADAFAARSFLFNRLFYLLQIVGSGRALRDEYADLVLAKGKLNLLKRDGVSGSSTTSNLAYSILKSRVSFFVLDSLFLFFTNENLALASFLPRTAIRFLRERLKMEHLVLSEPPNSISGSEANSVSTKFTTHLAKLCSEVIQMNFLLFGEFRTFGALFAGLRSVTIFPEKTKRIQVQPLWPLGVIVGCQALLTLYDMFKILKRRFFSNSASSSREKNNVCSDDEEDERIVFVPKRVLNQNFENFGLNREPINVTSTSSSTTTSAKKRQNAPPYQEVIDDTENAVKVTLNDEEGWPSCNICMCNATDPTSASCGHVFCWKCIVGWVGRRGNCPICRTKCAPQELWPVWHYLTNCNET